MKPLSTRSKRGPASDVRVAAWVGTNCQVSPAPQPPLQRVPRGCSPSHSLRSRAAEGRLTTVETMLLLVVLLRKAATKSFSEEELQAGSGQSRWVPGGFSPRREGRGQVAARPSPWAALWPGTAGAALTPRGPAGCRRPAAATGATWAPAEPRAAGAPAPLTGAAR